MTPTPAEGVRLNIFIADCTGLSRRQADKAIAAGAVRVDGKTPVLGQKVDPNRQKVYLDGKRLEPKPLRYILFHKPAGVVTTRHDPQGRKTIYDCLPEVLYDLDPVGRLDKDSSGLLLLTNDGALLQRLTHPRYGVHKTYRVRVDQPLTHEVVAALEAGISLKPENKLAYATVLDVPEPQLAILRLETGLNRQIRRSFEALGYTVKTLKRMTMGPLGLGKLKVGEFRPLKPHERKLLMTPQKTNRI